MASPNKKALHQFYYNKGLVFNNGFDFDLSRATLNLLIGVF